MMNFKKADKKISHSKLHKRIREGIFILTVALSVFLLVSLLSYRVTDSGWSNASGTVDNVGGYVGAWLADILLAGFGYAVYLFPMVWIYMGWMSFKFSNKLSEDSKNNKLSLLKFLGLVLIFVSGSFAQGQRVIHFRGRLRRSGGVFAKDQLRSGQRDDVTGVEHDF